MRQSKKVILTFLIMVFFAHLSYADSNFVFSVNSNPAVSVGLKMQKVVLFLGSDFNYYSHKSTYKILNEIREDEYSVFSLKPGFGIKYYLYESGFSPFISGVIIKEFPVSVDVKGDTYTKDEIADRYDDISYRISGGGDFSIKEYLFIGFELGISIFSNSSKSEFFESESSHILTYSSVTLTYMFN